MKFYFVFSLEAYLEVFKTKNMTKKNLIQKIFFYIFITFIKLLYFYCYCIIFLLLFIPFNHFIRTYCIPYLALLIIFL